MIKLLDILNELNIQPKDQLGSGQSSSTYPYNKDPEKIIKTVSDYDDNNKFDLEQIKIFQKHPDIFPLIYKVTDKYAVLEKLNINKAYNEMLSWGKQVKKTNNILSYFMQDEEYEYDDYAGILYYFLKQNSENELESLYSKIKDGDKLKAWVSLIKKAINLNLKSDLDIHGEQFGYNNNNKLKLLDF
jgi:hypothetical protein